MIFFLKFIIIIFLEILTLIKDLCYCGHYQTAHNHHEYFIFPLLLFIFRLRQPIFFVSLQNHEFSKFFSKNHFEKNTRFVQTEVL